MRINPDEPLPLMGPVYFVFVLTSDDTWEVKQIEPCPDDLLRNPPPLLEDEFTQALINRWIDDGPVMYYRVIVTGGTLIPVMKKGGYSNLT